MILCCGEALIDFVPLPKLRAYQPCPGGSVYNVAIGLGRLDTPVGFYSKVSTDFFGGMLIDYLVENNVNTSLCLRTPHPTTLAFVSLPSKEITEPQFSFYANGSADRSLTVDDLPPQLPETVKVLHFGSISLVLEPGATALETLMVRERSNRIISLDPNVRPNLIADHVAYRHRFDEWVASVDILKLSRADIGWIYPDAEFEECLELWFDMGVSLVIQTKGEDGAEGFTASGMSAYVRSPKVVVADTVGAGDTFLAAMLSFLYQQRVMDINRLRNLTKEELTASLSYAVQAAAINCSRIGAKPPYKREMESIDG
jgi:fructokinase